MRNYIFGTKIEYIEYNTPFTQSNGTFVVQYNKVQYIVVHCSVIVTTQST